jgi:hypothetical protein
MSELSNPAPEHLLEKIKEFVTDPDKLKRVEGLTEEEASAIATLGFNTEEQSELLSDPDLHILRVIAYRRLMDWASERANEIQEEILEFIGSESFVQYPDFLEDPDILSAAKDELINNHSVKLDFFRSQELEILGARINESGDVEILMTHNQSFFYSGSDVPMGTDISVSQSEYNLPPEITTGILKRNPEAPIYERPGVHYVSMNSLSTRGGFLELVLPELETE